MRGFFVTEKLEIAALIVNQGRKSIDTGFRTVLGMDLTTILEVRRETATDWVHHDQFSGRTVVAQDLQQGFNRKLFGQRATHSIDPHTTCGFMLGQARGLT